MKVRIKFFALILAISLITCAVIPAAASPSSIQDEIDELEAQAEELEKEKEALQEKIDANEAEILSFAEEKFQVDQQVELLRREAELLTAQKHQYNLLIAEKQAEIDGLQADLNDLTARYALRMRAIQEQGDISPWSVIFSSASFADMLNRQAMAKEIAKADQRMIGELQNAAQELLSAKDALSAEKTELERKKQELSDVEAELDLKRSEAEAMLTELAANKQAFASEMDEIQEQENDLHDQIAKKEQEYYDSLLSQIGGSSTSSSSSGFIFPLNRAGYVCITDAYGMRYHPTTGNYSMHNGVDFAAYQGTAIYASKSGVVTTAENHYIWGNYVVINHGDGTSTLYAHMTYDTVSYGDYVSQGQTIGYVGSTGWSTGPHLHFTIYINGSTVNPMDYVSP